MSKQKKAKQKFELTTLDVNNLQELDGFKIKAEKAVKEFPFIEITDSKTLKKAKEHRTGLRSTRTEFQGQDKLIGSFLNKFRKSTKAITENLISIVSPHEDKQQAEIDRYEKILEDKKREAEMIEQKRVDHINSQIEEFGVKYSEIVNRMTFETIDESKIQINELVLEFEHFDFEEYEPVFDETKQRNSDRFNEIEDQLIKREAERKEQIERDQESKINELYVEASKLIDGANEFVEGHSFEGGLKNIFDIDFDFGKYKGQFDEMVKSFKAKADEKMKSLFAEKERQNEIILQENKNRINNVREGLLDKVFQMDLTNYESESEYIKKALSQENKFPELQDHFDSMIQTVKKNFDQKIKMIQADIDFKSAEIERERKANEKRLSERIKILESLGLENISSEQSVNGFGLSYTYDQLMETIDFETVVQYVDQWKEQIEEIKVRTAKREKQLISIGFVKNEQKTENYFNSVLVDVEIWETLIEGLSDHDWNDYFKNVEQRVEDAKEANKAFQERKERLKSDKAEMIALLSETKKVFEKEQMFQNDESKSVWDEIGRSLELFILSKEELINKF